MGYKGRFGSAGEKEIDREDPFAKPKSPSKLIDSVGGHKTACAFLTSPPMTGDESSLCNCGAAKAAYEKWLAEQKDSDVSDS